MALSGPFDRAHECLLILSNIRSGATFPVANGLTTDMGRRWCWTRDDTIDPQRTLFDLAPTLPPCRLPPDRPLCSIDKWGTSNGSIIRRDQARKSETGNGC